MNQHLHSPTKLTEFARDFDDAPDTLLGRFVNKIQNVYNQSYNTVNDVSSGSQISKSNFYADIASEAGTSSAGGDNNNSVVIASETAGTSHVNNLKHSTSEPGSNVSSNSEDLSNAEINEKPDENKNEGRTMVNVLKRISNIMASKNSDLRNYKDTDLQRFWMPDSKAKECYDCSQKFSTFRRKHHCRLCGQIFCSKCCNQVVPGKIIMCSGDLKVCNYCSKIVLSYLKSPNIAVELHSDLQALQQDLSSKLESNNEDSATTSTLPLRQPQARKASLGYQEEKFATYQVNTLSLDDRKNILQQSNSLITLHEEMQRSLPAQNCGSNLIEYLNAHHKSSNKVQAVAILGAMLSAGFLQPIVEDAEQTEFDETLHYKFVELPKIHAVEGSDNNSQSEPAIPIFDAASAEPQPPISIDASLSLQSVSDYDLENSMRFTTNTSKLQESYCNHEEQLLIQMLRTYHLDLKWANVLTQLCSRAANQFRPEYCTNDLWDIRNYINFKKVPGGKRSECTIVGGAVFSKNVAHKDMPTRVERPRILLLQCPIVYERIEGKFVSISTVLLQEQEYLRNVCARILAFEPNVVLVHKNVAGVAQEMLRSKNVTLVLDVKYSVMERLARTLQCDILTSIESNITKPRLGICDVFYIKTFSDLAGSFKTLMFFEKLRNPRGYTCLLRGSNNKELAKVKRVAQFLLYARYNWRLEMSFLLDEFAQPLAPKPPIFDSKEPSPNDDDDACDENCSVNEETQQRSPFPKRKIFERKSEDKIFAAVTENVTDCTDPLRSTNIESDAKTTSDQNIVTLAVEQRYDNRFRNALSSTLLSVSPFLVFPLPYLETEQGRKCTLRSLFPAELYFSKLWSNSARISERHDNADNGKTKIVNENVLIPAHAFLKLKITTPVDNKDVQTLLAEFRSYGGRFPKKSKLFKMLKKRESYQKPQKLLDEQVYKDALDLENHQRLPVLFCSFYLNPKSASSFCAPPTLLDMKFYGQHDISLGQFLQRYCCVLTNICPLCKLPMLGHVRRYVHSMGCVQVFLSEDSTRTDPNRIHFRAWCSICNEVTPTVPIADTTKRLSFAKYLELRFHGHAYKRSPLDDTSDDEKSQSKCEHSLHRDYIHYFSYRGVGAKFQYTPINVWEIGLPPLILNLQAPKPFDRFNVLEEIKNYSMRGHEIYTRIHERIADLASEDENSPLLSNLKSTLSKDQFIFKQHVEIIQTLLTDHKANAYDLNDAMLMSKRVLAESIELWGPRLHDITLAQKAAAKQAHAVDAASICTEESRTELLDSSPITQPDQQNLHPSMPALDGLSQTESIGDDADTPSMHTSIEKKLSIEQFLNNTDKKSIKKILTHLLPSISHTNPLQSPFTAQEHYTLPLGAFPILVHDNDLSSIVAYSLTCNEYQKQISALNNATTSATTNNSNIHNCESSSVNNTSTTQPSPNLKRKSEDSSTDADDSNQTNNKANNNANNNIADEKTKSYIEILFHDHSTHFTCQIFFAKEFDLMRAKTLRPPQIQKSLYKEYEQSKKREEIIISQSKTGHEIELVRKPSDGNLPSYSTANNNFPIDGSVKSDSQQTQTDVDTCRNFLARSLCSSVQWEARGGKSGSRFCKTSDDRFVLKEMTRTEMNIFTNFAPNYFEYISKCQQSNHPTLLAKIFGVFKVTIKKKDSFVEKSLLVMENLFYDCDIKSKFDLKGSERNRLVNPTNQHGDEIVLLDENLVQMSWSKPLYILSHSKAVLKDALNRDSSFLEKNKVMDYSLLVGLDNKNSMLVLGIIDYIRTFTFDKKLESLVKQSGILGGMGKLPTVIPPQPYKQRFTDAMDRYFYTVPDRWEGLSKI